jgi:putative phosphoribosyl transferase
MLFNNRNHAGQLLASKLAGKTFDIVLGLPRGGIPVAYEIAKAMNTPMDLLLVRKLGCPGNNELAFGAISNHGEIVLNKDVINSFQLTQTQIDNALKKEEKEIKRRESVYRKDRPLLCLTNKQVLLTDDGVATGASIKVAIKSIIASKAKSLTLALPVIPPNTLEELMTMVDEVIYLQAPYSFYAVGQFYQDFSQTTDAEVVELMR